MAIHVDDIKALAMNAHRDRQTLDALFASMLKGEGREASQAAWALTHLPAADLPALDAHRADMVDMVLTTSSVPLRRMGLALLEKLEWNEDQVCVPLLDFCLDRMLSPSEPYGVKALCIKLAYAQCRHFPELCGELKQGLLLMQPDELGAGVRHTRAKILKLL